MTVDRIDPEGHEQRVLDVWVCTTCGEIQPRRGVDAHCAGSATEGLAHADAPMWATTATIAAAREDSERPSDPRHDPRGVGLPEPLKTLPVGLKVGITRPVVTDESGARFRHETAREDTEGRPDRRPGA